MIIYFFTRTMSVKSCWGLCVYMSLYVCVYSSQSVVWRSIVSQKYVRCCPRLSWKTLLRLHNSLFLNFQGSPLLGRWYLCRCVCLCVVYLMFLCKTVWICVLHEEAACSRVDAKGQQFVGVQIVEGAQVRQAQEEFGEEGRVIWATASDQWP